MKRPSYLFKMVFMSGISLSTIPFAHANQSPIDLEREKIIIFSRQGDSELKQAIPQLEKLFERTKDLKVRDDLIALYLRNNQSVHALKVCESCTPTQFGSSRVDAPRSGVGLNELLDIICRLPW